MNKDVQEFQQYVIAEAKSKNVSPEQYVKELGEEGLKQAYKRFQAHKKKQAQKAEHGAKLQYFKTLKNQCAEDEELVYYKKGGVVDCGCVKKEKGREVEEKTPTWKEKFNKIRKSQQGSTVARIADATGSQGGFRKAIAAKKKPQTKSEQKEGWDKHGNYIVTKKGIEQRSKQLAANKTKDETEPPKINKGIGKNCFGAKIKVSCSGSKMKK